MKKMMRIINIIAFAMLISFTLAGCKHSGDDPNSSPPGNPVEDYDITGTGTFTYDGTPKIVTVKAKPGKSPGAITVLYNGSTTAPVDAGSYAVTFNVAAVTGWDAVNGLVAGNLTINKAAGAQVPAPAAAFIGVNSVTLVAIDTTSTNQAVEYGINSSNSAPSGWQDGTTFNGLIGGTIYYFFARAKENNNYNAGTASGMAITTDTGDLSGTINITGGFQINNQLTVSYNGSENVSYQWNKNGQAIPGETINNYTPTEIGIYTVTVSAVGFKSKTSDLVVVTDPSVPTLGDDVTISPNTGVTTGMELTATYNGPETVSYQWFKDGNILPPYTSNKYTPQEAGVYSVTVSAGGYNPKLSNSVTVINRTPVAGDFSVVMGIGTYTYDGSARHVVMAANPGKSAGAITVLYNGSTTAPVDAGTYAVTFNVAAATGWDAASGLVVEGTLTINRAAGAPVSTPTAASIGLNSVTLAAISTTSTNQAVEYAMNTTNGAPSSGWQNSVTFNGLTGGTTYYFFARAQENNNYYPGPSSVAEITTEQNLNVYPGIWEDFIDLVIDQGIGSDPSADPIEVVNNTITVNSGDSITFIVNDSNYTDHKWTLNGTDTGVTGASYTFNTAGKVPGRDYIIGLRVKIQNDEENVNFYLAQLTVKIKKIEN